MKKHLPIVATAAAAALVLAGCSGETSEPDASASGDSMTVVSDGTGFGTEADVAALSAITWSEDEDGYPVLELEPPASLSDATAVVVDAGDGDPVVEGDVVTVDYTITNGADGTVLYSTYESAAPESFTVDEQLAPVLYEAFRTVNVGADVLFGSVDTTAEDVDQSTVYMAVTITAAQDVLDTAEGEAVDPVEGLPAITFGEDGIPTVSFDGAEISDELVVQPLIAGEGEALEQGQTAVVHYTGWLWDGEQFDSSWDRGAPASFTFAAGSLIDGWIEGLEGQAVGSRVLLVIPPELGYGEDDTTSIPGGSTLVFVVDILGAY